MLEGKDGAEGLQIAASYGSSIHSLLTDMVMPRMNGAELPEKLRAVRPDMRVVFMTGYAEFSGKSIEKLPAGTCTLQKPFSRSALLEKVMEV